MVFVPLFVALMLLLVWPEVANLNMVMSSYWLLISASWFVLEKSLINALGLKGKGEKGEGERDGRKPRLREEIEESGM